MLIISLPTLAKQPTEKAHGLTLYLLCGKLCTTLEKVEWICTVSLRLVE
nr:MAG TPA: hypothetical protein [Caudoviricetes sp.]